MKPPLLTLAALLLAGTAGVPSLGASTTIYVSPRGNDAWSGRLADPNASGTDGPLATLPRARDEVRKLKPAGPVTVEVRGGVYAVAATLTLSAEDAGTAQAPVVWQASAGEKPVIMGGRAIGGFQPYRGKILKADLKAQGLAGLYFRQLLTNGRRMDLARWPNRDADHPVTGGWAYADGPPVPMYADIPGEPRNVLRYKPADRRNWARPEEAEVMVFPRFNWWNDVLRIASIDRAARTYTLAADASYGIRSGDRYFVQNVVEELDAPGEWYLDKAAGTLYFWPPDDADPATMAVFAPAVRTILEFREGAAHITFRGFTFECAEGTAVWLHGARDCRIAGSTIRNVGDYNGSGVVVAGGKHNGVAGCDIYEVGRDAVSLDGGDRDTLEPAGNYADNNYIHHVGVFYKQGVGVSVAGVGNRVSHNLIHDCPRFGISWGGNDHVFEFNEIRHCDLETADCGAIYSWQVDWTRRGTQIRYNYLHHIVGFGQENGKWTSPHMNWGIYLDDGTCGTRVFGNIVDHTILGGVHVHGGRDNLIENNILLDGRDSQVQYSGYVAGGHPVPMITETWKKFSGTAAYRKYPGYEELTKSLDDAWQMAGNKFLRNIVCYREPDARLYVHDHLPYDQTESDYNLVWHYGRPVLAGVTRLAGLTGPNLAPNGGFERGKPGKLPDGWQWQVRPNDSTARLDREVRRSGRQSLRIEGRGTVKDSSGQTLCSNFTSDEIPLAPGHTYRLAASIRARRPTACAFMPQAYRDGKFFWAKRTAATAGPEWKRVETVFRFPAPGDAEWHEGMQNIRIRIDISQGTGTIWVDDVELREAEVLSEWEAWQALGLDRHSLLGDPLFVNPSAGDYRLKPDSPALELGFQPIPVDKIGPYRDEFRVSWPIKEAAGAREQMKLDWSRH
jgi:hypothetical protein